MSDSPALTNRSLSAKSPRLRSPVILLRSPANVHGIIRSPILKDTMVEITDEEMVDEVVDIIKTEERKKWLKGLFYLFMVVSTWVVAVQLTNNVMKNEDYTHPLFVAYINGSFFMIFGLGHGFNYFKNLFSIWTFGKCQEIHLSDTIGTYGSTNFPENEQDDHIIHTPTMQLSRSQMLLLSCQAALIYFGNASCATISLKYTSASNQTIFATTSSLFTLIVGSLCKVETFSVAKLISIVASITGIVLITFSDNSETEDVLNNPLLGDLIAISGAFLYSCYLILLRIKMGEETTPENDKLIFTYLGIFTLVLIFPLLVFADYIGFEELSLPDNKTVLLIIFVSGFLNCVSDYCSIIASLLTSPLITSLSLSTAIPVSMICDSLFYKVVNTSVDYYLGIIMIFSSFIFMNLSKEDEIIQEAIDDAIEEAIEVDEMLSPLLSPYLHAQGGGTASGFLHLNHSNDEIPGFSIDGSISSEQVVASPLVGAASGHHGPQVVVTGGYNHKYYIREIGMRQHTNS